MTTFEEKKETIRLGIAQGRTMQSIADEIGVSRQYVHAVSIQIGLTSPRARPKLRPSQAKEKKAKIAQEVSLRRADKASRKKKAVALVRDHGYSYDRAAKEIGMTGMTVKTACQESGIVSPQSNQSVEARKKEAVRLLKKGGALKDVASFTGLTQPIVAKLAHDLAYGSLTRKR